MIEIKKIFFGAVGYLMAYKNTLTKVLLIPFMLYLVLDIAEHYQTGANTMSVSVILLTLAGMLVQTVIAVSTHRIILLGPDTVTTLGAFNWSMRETRFAMYGFFLGIIMVFVMFPLLLIPQIGGWLAVPVVCWVIGRLSLVFPAIAIDEESSFSNAWDLSRNHQILMIVVVIVFPVLLFLPSQLFLRVPYGFVISSILSTLAVVFTVAALSVAYKYVKGR